VAVCKAFAWRRKKFINGVLKGINGSTEREREKEGKTSKQVASTSKSTILVLIKLGHLNVG
jgi:hypothetical protein